MGNNPQLDLTQVDIVSFDIFDTLLHRLTFAPMDVFDAVRSSFLTEELALFHPKLIDNFPHLRRLSEHNARVAHVETCGGEGEITYDEIYDQLSILYPLTDDVRKALQEKELELEKVFFYRSQEGFQAYSDAVQAGKRILFISDMYLPSSFLIETLQSLGYAEANSSSLFVSGERRCSKHSGELYAHVMRHLQLEPTRWLHVGDNLHADVSQAKAQGLKALHATWSKVTNVPRSIGRIADSLPAALLGGMSLPQYHGFYQTDDEYEKMGYEVFGPFLFGFYVWLLRKIQAYQPDKILFFARDAFLIQKIHEAVVADVGFETPYTSEYVYLSRKSLYPFSFADFPLYRIHSLIGGRSSKKLKALCTEYGIDLSLFTVQLHQLGLTPDSLVNAENHERIFQFFSMCFGELVAKSAKLREELGSFFTNTVKDCQKIAIVDIGWAGNMQLSLSRCITQEIDHLDIKGFYVGVLPHGEENAQLGIAMSGWFTDLHSHPQHIHVLHTGGTELLEFALTSLDGSTLGYEKSADGTIRPILEVKDSQEQDYERKALRVQKGILDFVHHYTFLFKNFPLEALDSHEWAKSFCELTINPTAEQIRLFSDLTHSDRPGVNSNRMALAKRISWFHRTFRTKVYREELNKAFWKRAFYYRNHRAPWKRRK